MILTGTVTIADNQYDYISAEGVTYEDARAKLDALLAEGQKPIVIPADHH